MGRTTGEVVALPVGLHLNGEAFEMQSGAGPAEGSSTAVHLSGQVRNFNTVEDFKNADKSAILNDLGQSLLRAIQSDEDPLRTLNTFTVLSFADLKKFKFIYWMAYPALLAKPGWQVSGQWRDAEEVYSEEQVRCRCALSDSRSRYQSIRSAPLNRAS